MSMSLDKQQQIYNWSWNGDLGRGKEDCGNLNANLDFLQKTGLLRPDLRVLEVGCGIGTLAHRLANTGCNVVATDLSNKAIAYGKEKYPDLELHVSPAERLPFPDHTFDLVVSFDLLEHVFHVDAHLREVKRVLGTNGHYAFATPNRYIAATYDVIRLGNFAWQKYHPSLHTYRQLRQRLKHHAFRAQFTRINTINSFTLAKLPAFGPLVHFVSKMDTRWLPWNLQSNFYVVAQKS